MSYSVDSYHAMQDRCDQLENAISARDARIAELEKDLERERKPYTYKIMLADSVDGFRHVECFVADIGYSERIVLLRSTETDELIASLENRLAACKAELQAWRNSADADDKQKSTNERYVSRKIYLLNEIQKARVATDRAGGVV